MKTVAKFRASMCYTYNHNTWGRLFPRIVWFFEEVFLYFRHWQLEGEGKGWVYEHQIAEAARRTCVTAQQDCLQVVSDWMTDAKRGAMMWVACKFDWLIGWIIGSYVEPVSIIISID